MTNTQQSLFDVLEAAEKTDKPYISSAGFYLPWEDPADTLSHPTKLAPLPIDSLQKRGKIAVELTQAETFSDEDRASKGAVPVFFYGKNFERSSHKSWNKRITRYPKFTRHDDRGRV